MTSSPPLPRRKIQSWVGLILGLALTGLSAAAYVSTLAPASLLSALAFASFTYPWSQLASFRGRVPMTRTSAALTYAGFALLAVSLLLRWWR